MKLEKEKENWKTNISQASRIQLHRTFIKKKWWKAKLSYFQRLSNKGAATVASPHSFPKQDCTVLHPTTTQHAHFSGLVFAPFPLYTPSHLIPLRHVIQFQTPSQMNPEAPLPTSEYNATSTPSLPKITVWVWRAEVCFWCRTQLSCATGSGPSWPYWEH